MAISPELLLAILAMDSYNRGYEGGLADNGTADLDGLADAEASVGWMVPRPSRGFTHRHGTVSPN
jgi:hypothetical protein